MTQWVAQRLLSKKQCLIYSEIKAEVRRGSALRQPVGSAAPHTQLYFVLFSKWKHRETESGEGDITKPKGRSLMKKLG